MHLSFQAAQTDASRAGESFIHLHPSFLKLHKDASLRGGKLPLKERGVTPVCERVEAMEKENG
jgi:hypothetical protein